MDFDFIKELGYKALDSRLKRISDRMSHDVRKFYKEFGIDVEPNWYLVFMLLQKRRDLHYGYCGTVGILSSICSGYCKKMTEKGYLVIKKMMRINGNR